MFKKLMLVAGILLAGTQGFSQIFTGDLAAAKFQDSDKIRIDPATGKLQYLHLKPGVKVTPATFPGWLRQTLKQSASADWRPFGALTDQLGFKHIRYQQYQNNVPAEGQVFIAHFKNGLLVSCNGESATLPANAPQVTLKPAEAIREAISVVGAKQYKWQSPANEQFLKQATNNAAATYYPVPQLVYAPVKGNFETDNYIPAYKVNIYASAPLERADVFLNAANGQFMFKANKLHTADCTAVAHTRYSGHQSMKTRYSAVTNLYRLEERRNNVVIHTRDLQRTFNYPGVEFTDPDKIWNNRNHFKDDAATDAHFGAEATYDYFLSKHNHNSFNGIGGSMLSFVHFENDFNNAFWDGQSMTYGDGDGLFMNPLTDIDIVGHEFSHGVTEYSAGLVYQDESGALNESFSDIFGAAIDFYKNGPMANYLIGEDVMVGATAFRSMQNPNQFEDPDTYLGKHWKTGPADNGGVHSNSGVQNFWFYLLANGGQGTNDIGSSYNVPALGLHKAEQIAFRTLTVYLGPTSNYADAAVTGVLAAEDLYGTCSPEVAAVGDAWYAVGVGNPYLMAASFQADNEYHCSFPATVKFTNKSHNGTTYLWRFGDGQTSTDPNPVHIYTTPGTYSVTLKVFANPAICGVSADSVVKTAYIRVAAGLQLLPAACTPPTTPAPTTAYGIKKLTFANITKASADATEGHKDFSCNQIANLIAGNVYELMLETGPPPPQRAKVWIDYNNDGSFDPVAELAGATPGLFILNTAITVRTPVTAILNTPLRMRIATDANTNGNITPCGTMQKGQIEDYSVIFTSQVSAPKSAFKATKMHLVPGFGTDFIDMSDFQPTSWLWSFPGGTPSTSTNRDPVNIVYATDGTYSVRLITSNAHGGPDTLTKSMYIRVGSGVTTVVEDAKVFKNLNVYPNPANDVIKIQYGFEGKRAITVTLLNALGQEITEQTKTTTDNFETELHVANAAAGIYLLRIDNGTSQAIRKVVLQK